MENADLALYIVKLVAGGLTAFTAVLLWSKTRDSSWMAMLGAIVINYAGIVYDLLSDFRIIGSDRIMVGGLPLTSLFFAVVPSCLFMTGMILMLIRTLR